MKYLDADFDPSFAEFFVSAPETQIVFTTERKVVDGRIEVIHPSIPNLFSSPPGELGCEVGPLGEGRTLVAFSTTREASATGEDYSEDNGILLFPPLSLSTSRFQVSSPSIVAFSRGTSHAVFYTELIPIDLTGLVVAHDFG